MDESINRETFVKLALKENRVFITSGQVYDRYRKFFPYDKCIHLSNSLTALDQFKELVNKCALTISLEDLFVRCSICNATPFIIVPKKIMQNYLLKYQSSGGDVEPNNDLFEVDSDEYSSAPYKIDFKNFSKMKFHHNVDKFYICPKCGHVYWDGCHSSNFIQSIKCLIVDAF